MTFTKPGKPSIKPALIASIHLHIADDEQLQMAATVFKREKKEYTTIKVFDDMKAFSDFLEQNKIPVCVLISGKGLIERETVLKETPSRSDVLSHLLPSAKADDLFLQCTFENDAKCYAAIARQEWVEKVLLPLQQIKGNIVSLLLGTKIMNMAVPTHLTIFQSPKATDKVNNAEQYCLNGASRFINQWYPLIHDEPEYISTNRKDLIAKVVLQQKLSITLAFIFVVLFANFLLFDHYSGQHRQLESQAAGAVQLSALKDSLSTHLRSKQSLLSENNSAGTRSMALLIDRLAVTVPEGIVLTELNCFPVKITDQDMEKKLSIEKDHIVITGTTQNSLSLNMWIEKLKKTAFIGAISLKAFSQQADTGAFAFSILITVQS